MARPKLVPAALRHARPVVETPDPATENTLAKRNLSNALNEFEQQIGGREILRDVLILGEHLDSRLQRLLILLSSAQLANSPLYNLCKKARVEPGEFFAALKPALIARAQVLMLHKVSLTGPKVVESILDQAIDREVPCPACEGEGMIDGKLCKKCKGTTVKKVSGKLSHQKMVLELLGFLKKGGGLTITQTTTTSQQQGSVQQAGGGSAGGALEALQQAVTDLMYGKIAPKEESRALPAADLVVPDVPASDQLNEQADPVGVPDLSSGSLPED